MTAPVDPLDWLDDTQEDHLMFSGHLYEKNLMRGLRRARDSWRRKFLCADGMLSMRVDASENFVVPIARDAVAECARLTAALDAAQARCVHDCERADAAETAHVLALAALDAERARRESVEALLERAMSVCDMTDRFAFLAAYKEHVDRYGEDGGR